ncbi:MAG: hypothetical protein J6B20_03130 [Clostridia bacterium]|nr:hypothetical protein [Clostridia bacterium]
MNKTQEIHKTLEHTFVVNFLESMMRREITNPVSRRGNSLVLSLTDHTMVKVTAPKVPADTLPPVQKEAKIQNIQTLRYVMQHDYGYGEEDRTELNRLELHNLDECRTYIEDAITSQLNAYFTNYLIEFYNGDKFMLAIELKQ